MGRQRIVIFVFRKVCGIVLACAISAKLLCQAPKGLFCIRCTVITPNILKACFGTQRSLLLPSSLEHAPAAKIFQRHITVIGSFPGNDGFHVRGCVVISSMYDRLTFRSIIVTVGFKQTGSELQ